MYGILDYLRSHLFHSGNLGQIVSLYTSAFGSCSANEVGAQLMCEMLQEPSNSNSYAAWERPMIFDSLSAVVTTKQGCWIKRKALVKPATHRPLGLTPIQCQECQVDLNQTFNGSQVGLSCILCDTDVIQMEVTGR